MVTHGRSGAADLEGEFSDADSIATILDGQSPDALVNLVALTDVELCERQPNLAYLGNTRSVVSIVEWLRGYPRSCHLIHLSTDQVYDGRGPHPEASITLTNYYAFSKYAGELAAANTPSTVLRTNFFGRSRVARRESITDWLFRSLSNADTVEVFDDIFFNPLSMNTLSTMIDQALVLKPIGVFNLGSRGAMSKADFAFAFAEEVGLPTRDMIRTRSDQGRVPRTYRPKDMRMACLKFEEAFQVQLPALEDEIKLVAVQYREQP